MVIINKKKGNNSIDCLHGLKGHNQNLRAFSNDSKRRKHLELCTTSPAVHPAATQVYKSLHHQVIKTSLTESRIRVNPPHISRQRIVVRNRFNEKRTIILSCQVPWH